MGNERYGRASQCKEALMKRHFLITVILASTALATSAFAADAPQLPASAKKLSAKEIASLYDGATIKHENFTQAAPFTGTLTFDLTGNRELGTYSIGNSSGKFSGRIRIVGDQWCHQEGSGAEDCASIYIDGDTIYEVGETGVVESRNEKQTQP
jgi:hypothetical protein